MSKLLFDFRLPFVLPSVNEYHVHWRIRHKEEQRLKNACGWVIMDEIRKQVPSIPCGFLVQIKYTCFMVFKSGRQPDAGNRYSKYCTDALVQAGVLFEDHWQYVSQETVRIDPLPAGEKTPFTLVEIFYEGPLRISATKALQLEKGIAREERKGSQATAGTAGRTRTRTKAGKATARRGSRKNRF